MRAVNMLGSMFEWLLQPVRGDEGEQPRSPTPVTADGQAAQAAEVCAQLPGVGQEYKVVQSATPSKPA